MCFPVPTQANQLCKIVLLHSWRMILMVLCYEKQMDITCTKSVIPVGGMCQMNHTLPWVY